MFDVLIVGGGASGLALAVMLRQNNNSISIAVAEKMDRVGKKLAITGNGRCNITNLTISNNNYYSSSLQNAMDILYNFDFEKTKSFFNSIGIEFTAENNKVYPLSLQANSVVDVLRFYASSKSIKIITDCKVNRLKKYNNVFTAICENKPNITAKYVVIATGGLAGGSKLGSDGDGYKLLADFGHKIINQTPVIVQVKTENIITRQLKGIKIFAKALVKKNQNIIAENSGEVLFCDYGLSGPPILQLSRFCTKGTVISLDLMPNYTKEKIVSLLKKRKEIFSSVMLSDFFAGIINKKLGQTLLKTCGINQNNSAFTLTESEIFSVAKKIKDFEFNVVGNTGFVNAQATNGGADILDFNKSLMSKKISGLFATGEVLDIDGDCGGYNLQWAWSSAATVSKEILNLIGENND